MASSPPSSSSSTNNKNLRAAHKAHRDQSLLSLNAVEKKGEEENPDQKPPFQFKSSVCSMEEIVVDRSVAEFAMATPVIMSTTGQTKIKSKKNLANSTTLNFKEVVAHCHKSGSLFRDESFPSADDDDDHDEGVVWKRVNGELEEKPLLWGINSVTGKPRKGPSPDDIIQGEVGDCWLLGAMAVLATRPELLKGVFPDKQEWNHGNPEVKHPGVFLFRFFKWGEWVEVLIDDRLPVKSSKLTKGKEPASDAFAFARLGPSRAYWPLLLEKAYAKLHGSYACLSGGHSSDAFVDFTGGVCANVSLRPFTEKQLMLASINEKKKKKKDVDPAAVQQAEASLESLWKRLKSASKTDRLISASIASGGGGGLRSDFHESFGLVLGHAYSVLDVRTLKEKGFSGIFSDRLHLIKLRNPWGDSEWTGAWSDGDTAWDRISKSEKKRLDIKVVDDGTFWMSFLDFITHFTTVRICRTFTTNFLSKWSMQTVVDSWPAGTSGRSLGSSGIANNPQYCLDIESGSDTVEDTDAGAEGKQIDSAVGTRVVLALAQRDPRLTVEAKEAHEAIGLVVHRVQENRKHVQVHSTDYIYKTSSVWINMREVTLEFIMRPGRYIIVPSAATAVDINTEFMIRLYSTGRTSLKKLTHNEPPRASKLIGKGKPASAALSVKIVRASGLTKVGMVRVADPYCTLRLNGKTYATRVQRNTLNPEFGEEFLFWFWGKNPLKGKELKLDVLDKNVTLDTHLGRVALPLGEMTTPGKRMGVVLNLQGTVKNQVVYSLLTVELKLMVGLDDILMV